MGTEDGTPLIWWQNGIAHILDRDRRRLADEMEQSFYKGKDEEPASAAAPVLDMQPVITLISIPNCSKTR